MVDPQTTQTQDQNNEFLWWSEDIFNNSDIFFDNTDTTEPMESTDDNELFTKDLPEKYNVENNESELSYADTLNKDKLYEYQSENIEIPKEISEGTLQETKEPEYKMDEKYYPKQEGQVVQKLETVKQSKPEDEDIEEFSQEQKKSEIQNKFSELLDLTNKVYELDKSIVDEWFEIIGADNDKLTILYQFKLEEDDTSEIAINKLEIDKESEEESSNELRFFIDPDTSSFNIILNDTLLFDELEDLPSEPKKKMQIIDKLNKFIFLAWEHLKKIEKEIKEKLQIEQERKKLQDIFRNF